MLPGGKHVGLDRPVCAALGLSRALQVHVPEHRFAMPRREINRCPRRDLLLLDDVADAPPAARPEAGHVDLRLVRRQIARAAAQLIGMQEHRRGEPRAGRFGQHAGDVVERRDPVEAHVAPARIDRVADDAGLAFGLEASCPCVRPTTRSRATRSGRHQDEAAPRRAGCRDARCCCPSGDDRRRPAASTRDTSTGRDAATRAG